jgi:hypothetical protein
MMPICIIFCAGKENRPQLFPRRRSEKSGQLPERTVRYGRASSSIFLLKNMTPLFDSPRKPSSWLTLPRKKYSLRSFFVRVKRIEPYRFSTPIGFFFSPCSRKMLNQASILLRKCFKALSILAKYIR